MPELKKNWDQKRIAAKHHLKEKRFWLNELSEEINILELPADYSRPSVLTHEGNSLNFEIDATSTAKLQSLVDTEGATMFMGILSIYNILLAKLCNQEDILIGTPVSGRHHADIEDIIGMFVNTLVLRNHPKGKLRFKEFLTSVKTRAVGCFDHQSYRK